jgi:hypothetical protein
MGRRGAYCGQMGYRRLGGRSALSAAAAFTLAAAGTTAAAAGSTGPVPGAPAAAVAPDASDTQSGAQAVPRPIDAFIAAIDRPGDVDWYSLRGAEIGQPSGSVALAVVLTGPGCVASSPLLAVLRNPEGRWMRTYAVSTSITEVPVPSFPSRYYLEVRAADSGCVGLQYTFPGIGVSGAAGGVGELASSALLCRIAHDDRVKVDTQVRRLKRARASVKSRAARRRYARYLQTKRRELQRTRAEERRTCANA